MRALLLLPILLLAACGQSGDLYLPPKDTPPPESAAPPDSSARGQAPAPGETAPVEEKKDKQ